MPNKSVVVEDFVIDEVTGWVCVLTSECKIINISFGLNSHWRILMRCDDERSRQMLSRIINKYGSHPHWSPNPGTIYMD
ncbi:hypothetical protein LCGC14_2400700 [marine sediment metagenome]|uniref:Uncharacterized protein n=1 Tax=marine sediment metagenome TaxID=412755 RepID=A0A0F9E7T8_9ZZZZ